MALTASTIETEAFKVCKAIVSHPARAKINDILVKYTRNRNYREKADDQDYPAELKVTVSVNKGESKTSASDRLIFGDVAQRQGHQFSGYIATNERHTEYANKLGAFPELDADEAQLLEWGHRTLRGIAAKIVEHIPLHLRKLADPYERLNPSSLGPTPSECSEGLPCDALVASFLAHPSLDILRDRPALRKADEDKLRAYVDGVLVGVKTYDKPKFNMLTPEKSLAIAEDSRHRKDSIEHLGTALFVLRDSLMNLMQMLFCSFIFKRIEIIDEDRIFQIKPRGYGDFDFSYLSVAELLRLSAGDPFLLLAPSVGWSKPSLSFINSWNMSHHIENGLEVKIGFRTVDKNLSAFSNLL